MVEKIVREPRKSLTDHPFFKCFLAAGTGGQGSLSEKVGWEPDYTTDQGNWHGNVQRESSMCLGLQVRLRE